MAKYRVCVVHEYEIEAETPQQCKRIMEDGAGPKYPVDCYIRDIYDENHRNVWSILDRKVS